MIVKFPPRWSCRAFPDHRRDAPCIRRSYPPTLVLPHPCLVNLLSRWPYLALPPLTTHCPCRACPACLRLIAPKLPYPWPFAPCTSTSTMPWSATPHPLTTLCPLCMVVSRALVFSKKNLHNPLTFRWWYTSSPHLQNWLLNPLNFTKLDK